MDVIYRYDPYAPIETRGVPNAAAAKQRLIEGNERFVDLVSRMQQRTLGESAAEPSVVPVSPLTMGLPLFPGGTPTQAPFAAVVGCADARVPTESVFDQAFNDLFVLRVAGNVLGSEGLGSLHYALKSFTESLKMVVVLGHAKCGAVTTACDAYRCPETYADVAVTHELRSIIDQLQIAARAASLALEAKGDVAETTLDERSKLTSVAVYVNAAVTALALGREIRMFGAHSPAVAFGVYDFDSMRVQELPGSTVSGLRSAPESAKELTAYAREVAESLLTMDGETQARSCQMTVQW